MGQLSLNSKKRASLGWRSNVKEPKGLALRMLFHFVNKFICALHWPSDWNYESGRWAVERFFCSDKRRRNWFHQLHAPVAAKSPLGWTMAVVFFPAFCSAFSVDNLKACTWRLQCTCDTWKKRKKGKSTWANWRPIEESIEARVIDRSTLSLDSTLCFSIWLSPERNL